MLSGLHEARQGFCLQNRDNRYSHSNRRSRYKLKLQPRPADERNETERFNRVASPSEVTKMKMKSIVLLIVATGCGLVAMLGVQKVLSSSKGKKTATSRVLIATLEIAPGIALDDTNVIFKEWPANAIPEGAVTSEEEIENRALRIRAVAGEVIMLSKLGGEGELG